MINVLQDGFSNFQNHFWIILCIFLAVICGQVVMQKILSEIFDNRFTDDEYFALSLSGWVFPIFCWAGIYFLVNILFGKIIAGIISIIIFAIPFIFMKIKKISSTIFSLSLFLLLSLCLRLAFLEQAVFPAYFDSAQHYQNIQNIISIYENNSSSLFQSNYYHLGYHFLSASFIHLFQFNQINFMLVFGQIILAILPISFFFLLKQITQSNTVAIFTCLIAGFGFHMPAHLVNWGKYPALLSLVGIQFVLCLGYLIIAKDLTQNKKTRIYWLIAFSIVSIALFHTRSLILFTLIMIAYFFTLRLKQASIRSKYFIFGLVMFALGIEIFYIQQNVVLSPLISGYSQRDLWTLTLVLIFIPFSIRSYPNPTFFLFTSLCLFIFSLFFPISLFNYGTQTLLDRPYVQMLAYIPLSILAGLGFAGLLEITHNFSYAKFLISFILFGFVIVNAKINYSFYPSDCCQLVSRDDLSAIAWIDKTISLDAKILIVSSRLYVTSFESLQSQAGADAGIWIHPLISRTVVLAPTEVNFELNNTHTELCSQNIQYIYIGSMPQSFNQERLASRPKLYFPVFLVPRAQVYKIIGCD